MVQNSCSYCETISQYDTASLLGSMAAVEVGEGVATGEVESKTAGVEVVIGVAALVDAGMVVVTVVASVAAFLSRFLYRGK
jgi:hypothetical protein